MPIIDSQIHIWESETKREWDPAYNWGSPPENAYTIETAIAAMDAVGVDRAVISLVPGYRHALSDGVYRYDNSYAEEASTRFPDRLASVARYDPFDPELEDLVAATLERPGTLGIRIVAMTDEERSALTEGVYDRFFATASKYRVPTMFYVPKQPELMLPVAKMHADLNLIIDHFGIKQRPLLTPNPHDPWEDLPHLLALAKYPNVSVKVSAAPSLSNAPYPYRDVWEPFHRVIEGFGVDRLMWGSDVTRVRGLHTYAQSLFFLSESEELSSEEKEKILGANLQRILGWP